MIERKSVLSRRGKILTFFSLVVALTSAVVAAFNLASPLFPPFTIQVANHIAAEPEPVSYQQHYAFPEITFQTPALDANTTLQGNVTLCCLKYLPLQPPSGSFVTPDLFVFSATQYIAMKGGANANPWMSPSEASITAGGAFPNYTLNGPAGTEILSIQFTPKTSGVYYLLVESRNGETQGRLYLTYYKSQIVENPWVYRVQLSFGILSILGFIATAVEAYRTFRAPEEMIKFHPRQLLFKVCG
jgi:hypothetical protein